MTKPVLFFNEKRSLIHWFVWSQTPLKSPVSQLPVLSSHTKQAVDLISHVKPKVLQTFFGNQEKASSFDTFVVTVVVYSFESEGKIGLKWVTIFYFQSSCMRNKYVLVNKSQLNNHVSSKVNLIKIRIPLFLFYSKFLCARQTNPNLTNLRDFAEGCIKKNDTVKSVTKNNFSKN